MQEARDKCKRQEARDKCKRQGGPPRLVASSLLAGPTIGGKAPRGAFSAKRPPRGGRPGGATKRQTGQRPEAGTPGGGEPGGRTERGNRQRPEAGTPGGGEEEEEEEKEEARKKKQNLHTG